MSGYNLPGGCTESHIDALSDDERPAYCDRCGSRNGPDDMTLRGGEDMCPKCLAADDDASCGGECQTVDPDTGRCADCDREIVTVNHAPAIGPDAPGF